MLFNSSNKECGFVKDGIAKARGGRAAHFFKIVIPIKQENSCFCEANELSKDSLQNLASKFRAPKQTSCEEVA